MAQEMPFATKFFDSQVGLTPSRRYQGKQRGGFEKRDAFEMARTGYRKANSRKLLAAPEIAFLRSKDDSLSSQTQKWPFP